MSDLLREALEAIADLNGESEVDGVWAKERARDALAAKPGSYDDRFEYPPTLGELKEERRSYRDEAAAAMFVKAGGRKLQASATKISEALYRQADNLCQYHSSPFTAQHMETMKMTLEALERTQEALREWHLLVYPNQRPVETKVKDKTPRRSADMEVLR